MNTGPVSQGSNLRPDNVRPQEIDNQPPRHQLNSINQQNPIRRIGDNQPGELNNGWNTPKNRITVLVMVWLSLGIGTTIKGLITSNDQLISDGVYGTLKALRYALFAGILLNAVQQRNQPERRMHWSIAKKARRLGMQSQLRRWVVFKEWNKIVPCKHLKLKFLPGSYCRDKPALRTILKQNFWQNSPGIKQWIYHQ